MREKVDLANKLNRVTRDRDENKIRIGFARMHSMDVNPIRKKKKETSDMETLQYSHDLAHHKTRFREQQSSFDTAVLIQDR
jgi:hypothetical protein